MKAIQKRIEVECDCLLVKGRACEEKSLVIDKLCSRPKGHTGNHRVCAFNFGIIEHNLEEWRNCR